MPPTQPREAVVARVGGRSLALPVAHVVETMRPLPIVPEAGAPAFVVGIAQIRGAPCRVVDLARLLGVSTGEPAGRFVVVRSRGERMALQVAAVLEVRPLDDRDSLEDALAGQAGVPAALTDALSGARWICEVPR